MKTKLIFTATIAVIALLFIWIFREDLTPESAMAIVISAVGNIVLLWKWINQKEETVSTKKAFEAYSGMSVEEFREMK